MRASELTVAIPTRERWEILRRTLRALEQQTVSGFRTVVVCDGTDQRPPYELDGVRFLFQEQLGPGAARNLAVSSTECPLTLFLGDDMVPAPDLVERHLERHAREPAEEVAVLGHVRWHPEISCTAVMRWLDWSGSQFDYRQLGRENGDEAGFGRFYSCNVSLKRRLFLRAGGFDPSFRFDYEDLDLGWRLHTCGMRLVYEPRAVASHLHRQDLTSIESRFESHARGERLMCQKHDWFEPWFYNRIRTHAEQPPVSRLWPMAVDLLPERIAPLRSRIEARADRWYHQRLAPRFLAAWEGERDLEELRAYLGAGYDERKLFDHARLLDEEAAAVGDAGRFYRSSEQYLYDLTAFAMWGTKEPYRRQLITLFPPGSSLLDYGCGVGSDGLRMLEAGYRVAFADFDNPSTRYLRWRLERRGLEAAIYDLDRGVPGGFDAAYAFDVIEHVEDPFAFLAELEQRAAVVVVNLLEPLPGETALHNPLPVSKLLSHATSRGLVRYRRYHGRSHLVAYRPSPAPTARARARSVVERAIGPRRRSD
jgi:GT2 family glycosyltransferase/2-polyprenyl-3-methyl-5-hydroxy-6-metoxy-1,4-benzoquinol methylase